MKDKTLINGDVTELRCILAFEKRGYYTSIPFGKSCRYDVISDINGKLIRIQCKSSYYNEKQNCIQFSGMRSTTNTKRTIRYKYTKDEIDYFYTFFKDYDFLIPVEEVSSQKFLRLQAPQNNQFEDISIAHDYLLDNVLNSIKDGSPIAKFVDSYIISIDINTKEIKEWGSKELQETFSDRQFRYIREAINMHKIAYNKKWIQKEFPTL